MKYGRIATVGGEYQDRFFLLNDLFNFVKYERTEGFGGAIEGGKIDDGYI